MRHRLLINLPSVILLLAALLLPEYGKNTVWKMNWSEFAKCLAILWMAFAIGFRIVGGLARASSMKQEDKGFEVLPRLADGLLDEPVERPPGESREV